MARERNAEAPATAEAPKGLKVETSLVIEDNTAATEVEVREVSVEKVELMGGLFQENFA